MSSPSHEICPEQTSFSSSSSKSQRLQLQTNAAPIRPASAKCEPTLLGMPLEIRNIIYEMCLCVRGCIVPYKDASQPDYSLKFLRVTPSPSLAILSTNKQIREEGLPILFSKNWFHITSHGNCLTTPTYKDNLAYHPIDTVKGNLGTPCTEEHHASNFWRTYGRYMKQIVMVISVDPKYPLFIERPHGRDLSYRGDWKRAGKTAFARLEMNWQEVAEYLRCCINVKHVWIEVGSPSGLYEPCRWSEVRQLFRHHLVTPNPHAKYSVTGMKWSEKEQAIVDEWRAREAERWQGHQRSWFTPLKEGKEDSIIDECRVRDAEPWEDFEMSWSTSSSEGEEDSTVNERRI